MFDTSSNAFSESISGNSLIKPFGLFFSRKKLIINSGFVCFGQYYVKNCVKICFLQDIPVTFAIFELLKKYRA